MMTIDIGHWTTKLPDFDPFEYFGFCYLATNNQTGKMYIGKKNFWSKRNGRLVESDWKKYTTSSTYVNNDLNQGFTFEILSLHTTNGNLTYKEIELQMSYDVLRRKFANGERMYYNQSIGNIKFIPPDEASEETRKKVALARRNKIHRQETKDKIAKALKDKNKTQDHKDNIAKGKAGCDPTPASFQKGHIPWNKKI